ncbi:hypothetical protein [Lactovum odontotermitis]
MKNELKLFESQSVRSIWDETNKNGSFLLSFFVFCRRIAEQRLLLAFRLAFNPPKAEKIGNFIESPRPRKYWTDLKKTADPSRGNDSKKLPFRARA